ncbi:unnamed protein product [Heligmosomoides polygyrus]|uniref:Uncharacterized protein n=1 Tax=Heligmosomoides polygyrus TaxID=6339 RepID=A0A3P8DRG5_HELPZ|nr:unnamed protein product [Heligmosomoides polygyrus]
MRLKRPERLKQHLRGREFADRRHLEMEDSEFFSSQPSEFCRKGIERLPGRWTLKGKLYRTVVRPALLYGSECWALDFEAPGKRPRGAPRKRWKDVIKRDLAEVGATADDALEDEVATDHKNSRPCDCAGLNAQEKKKKKKKSKMRTNRRQCGLAAAVPDALNVSRFMTDPQELNQCRYRA